MGNASVSLSVGGLAFASAENWVELLVFQKGYAWGAELASHWVSALAVAREGEWGESLGKAKADSRDVESVHVRENSKVERLAYLWADSKDVPSAGAWGGCWVSVWVRMLGDLSVHLWARLAHGRA